MLISPILDRTATIETFRAAVLEALDRAANETFKPGRNDSGATDADLPRLFKAIEIQVDALAARYDAILIEPVTAAILGGPSHAHT